MTISSATTSSVSATDSKQAGVRRRWPCCPRLSRIASENVREAAVRRRDGTFRGTSARVLTLRCVLVEGGLEQLYFTTCRVAGAGKRAGDEMFWTGTGFVYQVVADGPEGVGAIPFLVSNKHVLAPKNVDDVTLSVTFVKRRQSEDQPEYGSAFTGTFDLGQVAYAPHPNPDVDVAVVPLGPLFNAMSASGQAFYRSLSPDILLSDDQADQLLAVEDLLFVGYPTGIFDSSNVLSVVRRGMTATPISMNYEGRPAFLIDGSVWPGSSGSPVMIANQGVYGTKQGSVAGSRTLLVGVLAAVHVHRDLIPVVPVPTASAGVLESPIGLGIVFKATTIDECVDLIFGANGMTRVPITPAA